MKKTENSHVHSMGTSPNNYTSPGDGSYIYTTVNTYSELYPNWKKIEEEIGKKEWQKLVRTMTQRYFQGICSAEERDFLLVNGYLGTKRENNLSSLLDSDD